MNPITRPRGYPPVMLATIFLLVAVGCGDTSKSVDPAPSGPQTVEQQIKGLVPAAAGYPTDAFEQLVLANPAPDPINFKNQPLTIVVLSLQINTKTTTDKHRAVFDFGEVIPKPNELAEAMALSKANGYYSVLQPGYITDVTCKVQNDTAQGEVAFGAGNGTYKGRIGYRARKQAGAWQVYEFYLPVWNVRTVLQADGNWKMSGENVRVPEKPTGPAEKS